MVVLFRTARQPVVYLSKPCSVATLFRALCLILKFGVPVLICFFYLDYSPGYTCDLEKPTITPNDVRSFVAKTTDGDDYHFSRNNQIEESVVEESIIFQTIPHYSGSTIDFWTVSVKILKPEASNISYVSILFDFKAQLHKWADITLESIGSFTQSFPSNLNSITTFGDLVFEQNEIVNFRGKPPNEDRTADFYMMHSDILEKQNNLTNFCYVEWKEPLVKYGYWHSFELNLRIYVKDFKVWHTIPLVTSIESILTLYLSTVIMTSLILDNLQGFVFRKGYIKSWENSLCEKTQKVIKIQQ